MMAFLAAWWAMSRIRARKRKGNTSSEEEVAGREELFSKLQKSMSDLQESHKSVSDLQELPGVPLEHELDGVPRAELEGTEVGLVTPYGVRS